jgi:hypothetical protein
MLQMKIEQEKPEHLEKAAPSTIDLKGNVIII